MRVQIPFFSDDLDEQILHAGNYYIALSWSNVWMVLILPCTFHVRFCHACVIEWSSFCLPYHMFFSYLALLIIINNYNDLQLHNKMLMLATFFCVQYADGDHHHHHHHYDYGYDYDFLLVVQLKRHIFSMMIVTNSFLIWIMINRWWCTMSTSKYILIQLEFVIIHSLLISYRKFLFWYWFSLHSWISILLIIYFFLG